MRMWTRRAVGALAATGLAIGLAACDPAPDGTRWDSFRGGPAATGITATTISSAAKVRWTFDPGPGADAGQPVIAGAMVVAPVSVDGDEPDPEQVDHVIAFDQLTGAVRWDAVVDDVGLDVAAGGGRVVVVGRDTIRSLDLATGRQLWIDEAPEEVSAAPVVSGGVAYVASGIDRGPSDVGYLAAFHVDTGFLWVVDTPTVDGEEVTPTVAGDVVYLGGKCGGAQAYRRSDGKHLWTHPAGCTGGGSEGTAAVRGGRLYSIDGRQGPTTDDGAILDAATGRRLGGFTSRTAPVVGASHLITTDWTTIDDRTADGRSLRWRHQLRGMTVQRHPVVADQQVLVVTKGDDQVGYLLGLRLGDGREVLRVRIGPFTDASENGRQRWLAAAEGVAAVSIQGRLTVIG